MTFVEIFTSSGSTLVNTDAICRIEATGSGKGSTLALLDGTTYQLEEDARAAIIAINTSTTAMPRILRAKTPEPLAAVR